MCHVAMVSNANCMTRPQCEPGARLRRNNRVSKVRKPLGVVYNLVDSLSEAAIVP